MKRPRPSYKAESSISGNNTSHSQIADSTYDSNQEPKKKANIQTTFRTSQKIKLEELDGGSCLITGETDGECIQVCRVLQRSVTEEKLKLYKKHFGMSSEIYVDSIKNLIHLRADWHRSFEAGCWALVPTTEILNDIIQRLRTRKKWQFSHLNEQVYDYEFVHFPSLGQKPIYQLTEEEDEYTRIAYDEMPLLQSHIHPYFVIANALPKFQNADLTASQIPLAMKLNEIDVLWRTETGTSCHGGRRRRRGRGGSKDVRGDTSRGVGKRGGGARGKARDKISHEGGKASGPSGAGVDGNEGMAGGVEGVHMFQIQEDARDKSWRGSHGDLNRGQGGRFLTPPASISNEHNDGQALKSSNSKFLDDQSNAVIGWREHVMKAGPPEPFHQNVVWSVQERARRPYRGDWGEWTPKWNCPPDRSKFTSNDWAIFWEMFNLPYHHLTASTD